MDPTVDFYARPSALHEGLIRIVLFGEAASRYRYRVDDGATIGLDVVEGTRDCYRWKDVLSMLAAMAGEGASRLVVDSENAVVPRHIKLDGAQLHILSFMQEVAERRR